MRIIKNKSNTDFQIRIGNQYVTVASLVPWLLSKHLHEYSLFFYYYGEEFEKGTYSCQHINGNTRIKVWEQEDECWSEFIERVKKIVVKKLYVIGASILEEVKYTEQ
ncbi:MAG: hypothetical protein HDQ99_02890 [Lachnospiraceae bacterium]|nr:hypothetical protein [Lachnospiraceae bacterium]